MAHLFTTAESFGASLITLNVNLDGRPEHSETQLHLTPAQPHAAAPIRHSQCTAVWCSEQNDPQEAEHREGYHPQSIFV